MHLTLDTGIFLAFLALNLVVGLYYGRGVKTIQDYALGGRNFSTGALVATLVATAASGSGFFIMLSKTYSDGFYYVIAGAGMAISFYITAIFFIPKMGEFLGKTTIAEAMGDLYGKHVRIIVAVAGTIGSMGIIAVQFKAFGNIFHYFLGFPEIFSILLAGSVVTIYSAFGGIRSVTFTDVLQFVTFGVAIPLVGLLIWHQLYETESFSVMAAFEHPKFDISAVFNIGNPKMWEMVPIFLYFAMPMLEPTFCQRIFIGRNVAQVKKAFILAAVIFFLVRLSIEWIPFLVFNVDPNIPPNHLLSYIIDHYTYTGLKGLIIISITALAMSTADSFINSSSVLFSNDICKPLNIVTKNELIIPRIFAFALGVGSVVLALSATDLLSIILGAASFYTPIVVPPLGLTILGFRSSAKSVLIGMASGFVTVVVWNLLDIETDCIIFATLVNLIFLMGSHYLLKQPGGWVGIKDTRYLDELRDKKARSRTKFIKSIKEFSFAAFLKNHSPSSELTYTGFGVYCIFYTFTTMYSTQHNLRGEQGGTILLMYQIMLVTGVVMALYPIWPPRIKNEIVVQSWWNIAIFYMLSLFSMFFVLLSEFTSLQCMVFTMNTVVAITLTGWRLGSLVILTGFYAGFEMFKWHAGQEIDIDFAPEVIILYTLLLLSSVVVIFLKPKQEQQELSDEKIDHLEYRISDYRDELYRATELKNEFLRNIQHEARTPITGITSMAQVIDEIYDKLPEARRRQAIHDMAMNAERLESYVNNLIDLSELSSMKYKLKIQEVNLSNLVREKLDKVCKLYIPESTKASRDFKLKITQDIIAHCDEYYMGRTIENIIINAVQYCKQGVIHITLTPNKDGIEFSVKDEGIGIPTEDMKDIFGAFITSSKTKTPAGGRGVGLALAKKVIDLHKGTITAESDGKSWTKVGFVL